MRQSLSQIFVEFLLLFCLFSLPQTACAKLFKNSYVSFELPLGWDCQLKNKAWICRFKPPKNCQGKSVDRNLCKKHIKRTKEAIFILTAKEVGQRDNFKSYETHLKKSRPILTQSGKKTASKNIHLKYVKIDQRRWLDGMHLGSEIPHYYTRYLSTINGRIAVLVTLSAHQRYYTKYSAEFFKTIKSLKILTDSPQQIDRKEFQAGKTGVWGQNGTIDLEGLDAEGNLSEPGGANQFDFMLLIGAFFLALFALILWVRGSR